MRLLHGRVRSVKMNKWEALSDVGSIREALDGLKDDDTLYVGYLRKLIENGPEVVRCADCQYFRRYDYFGLPIMYCERVNKIEKIHVEDGYYYMVTEATYCAWGEKKSE